MRMIARVHDDTTVARTDAFPAGTAGFTDGDVFIVRVADYANRSAAAYVYLTKFARRKAEQCIVAFFSHELSRFTSGADHLAAFADFQFDVVYERTEGDVLERQCVADLDIRFRTAVENVADFQAVRSDDVFLFAICVEQKSDVSRAVRIVFDRRNFCRDVIFNTFEVDQTVTAFVTTALMADSHTAAVITTALIGYFSQ